MNFFFYIVSSIALILGFWSLSQTPDQAAADLTTEVAQLKADQRFLLERIEKLKGELKKSQENWVSREAASLNQQAEVPSHRVSTNEDEALKLKMGPEQIKAAVDEAVNFKIDQLQSEGKWASGESLARDQVQKRGEEKSLEDIAREIDLTDYEFARIEELKQATESEVANLFKGENETIEEFKERMKEIESDPIKKAEFTQESVTYLFQNGGLAKVMKMQTELDKKLKDLLGKEKYLKYKNHSGSQGLSGIGVTVQSSPLE